MKNFLILLFGFLVAALAMEIVLRILPKDLTKLDYGLLEDERIYTFSRYVKFKPNFTRVWTGLGEPTVWHFNNLGFRERAVFINKPQNIYRIVVIGDSIV